MGPLESQFESPVGSEIGEIHLPERWVVLEEALREMQASAPKEDELGTEKNYDPAPAENTQRDRDAEDTRSRNQPVRPSSRVPSSGDQPRGGIR